MKKGKIICRISVYTNGSDRSGIHPSISNVKKQREELLVVGGLAIGYIVISALIMFNVEPATLFGIATVALPAGIVTAGYMEEINKDESL